MNIAELLKQEKTVNFKLAGKTHKLKMQSPSVTVAKELRTEFYALEDARKKVGGGEFSHADAINLFEIFLARVVKACLPPASEEAKMDDETARQFIMSIGFDKSEVAHYAMSVIGLGGLSNLDDAKDDHTDF